jgi:hypothetical protein
MCQHRNIPEHHCGRRSRVYRYSYAKVRLLTYMIPARRWTYCSKDSPSMRSAMSLFMRDRGIPSSSTRERVKHNICWPDGWLCGLVVKHRVCGADFAAGAALDYIATGRKGFAPESACGLAHRAGTIDLRQQQLT